LDILHLKADLLTLSDTNMHEDPGSGFFSITQIIPNKAQIGLKVRDVVLVCKRWSTLSLDDPPQNQKLQVFINSSSDMDEAYLLWVQKLGPSVREVEIDVTGYDAAGYLPGGLLSRALAICALSMPLLWRLAIRLPMEVTY